MAQHYYRIIFPDVETGLRASIPVLTNSHRIALFFWRISGGSRQGRKYHPYHPDCSPFVSMSAPKREDKA